MANVLVEESCLSGIASAIRTQNGLNTLYKPSEMMSGINDLKAREAWAIFNGKLDSKIAGSTVYEVSTSYLKPGAFIGYTASNYANILRNFNCSNVTSFSTGYFSCFGAGNMAILQYDFAGQFTANVLMSEITLRSDISRIGDFMFNYCTNLSKINFTGNGNLLSNIGNFAFTGCSKLSTIDNFPFSTNASFNHGCLYNTGIASINLNIGSGTIGVQAFGSCSNLSSVVLVARNINSQAFANCGNLTFLSLSVAGTISSSAFYSCNLSGEIYISGSISNGFQTGAFINSTAATNTFWLNLPDYSSTLSNITGNGCIGISAKKANVINITANSNLQWVSCDTAISANLGYNSNLQSVYFSTLSSSGVFTGCSNLTTASLPNYAIISQYAFSSCSALSSINLPEALTLANYAFAGCTTLANISLPKAHTFNTGVFRSCHALSTISLPMASVLWAVVFSYCSKLVSLYLMGSSVCKLSSTASGTFSGCPIYQSTVNNNVYGSIYVPSSLYATYIASTNWVELSSRFVSI